MSTPNPMYEKDKPGQGDPFSDWQQNILTNFAQLSQAFANNHVGFYSSTQPVSADQGKHTYVQLFSGPTPQTELSENNIYSKLDAFNASQLFMGFQNNTADFQYSSFQFFQIPNALITPLPGNFQFWMGILPYPYGDNNIIAYPTYVKNVAYASVSSQILGTFGVNYFVVSVVDVGTTGQLGLKVIWNGTGSPKFFYFMTIMELKVPT